MIVLCSDLIYYRTPKWVGDNWEIECNEIGTFLTYRGNVKWRTAVKVFRKNGFSAVQVDRSEPPEETSLLVDGKMVPAVCFEIRLTRPPRRPDNADSVIQFKERPYADEEVVDFIPPKRVRKKKEAP